MLTERLVCNERGMGTLSAIVAYAGLCLALKLNFLARYDKNVWSKSHQARVDVLRKICNQLYEDDFNRSMQRRTIEEGGGEIQPEEIKHPNTDYDYDRINGNLFNRRSSSEPLEPSPFGCLLLIPLR